MRAVVPLSPVLVYILNDMLIYFLKRKDRLDNSAKGANGKQILFSIEVFLKCETILDQKIAIRFHICIFLNIKNWNNFCLCEKTVLLSHSQIGNARANFLILTYCS